MAFNKAKALQEAENLANQGKISQAIKRYLDILEKDPSELILLNTIGDLYIREKNVSEGLKQFYRLAEAYVQEGYALKAIAIYRKIVKLEPDSVAPLLKLGELYQAQRLVREAREIYYQLAERYEKKEQNDKALETLRKVVQLDPENAKAKGRLAAFYEQMGHKEEAGQVYLETAQLALRLGDAGSAQVALRKAQELNPNQPQIQLLRAREALALKHPEDVEQILSRAPGLKDDPAAPSLLVESYVAMQQPEKAKTLALRLFRANPADFSPLACFVSACAQVGEFDAASQALYVVADELIRRGNTRSLMESLLLIRSKSPQHLPTLELIFRIYDESRSEDTEILEGLGHTFLKCGQFEEAARLFQRLVDREPANEHYRVLLRDVSQKRGEKFSSARAVAFPCSATAFTREEAAAPPASPLRVVDREAMVKEALEKSDLLARYHLVSRAVAELDTVLELFPDETDIHKRLVGMCWRDLPERAEQAARALASIYAQQGNAEEARRFAQMAGEREAAATLAVPPQAHPTQAPTPEPPPPLPAQSAAHPAAPVWQEIDLSQDWESFLAQTASASPAPQIPRQPASFNYDDSRTEINFYLEQGLFEEARMAVGELEGTLPGDPRIAELRALVEAHAIAPEAGIPTKAARGSADDTPTNPPDSYAEAPEPAMISLEEPTTLPAPPSAPTQESGPEDDPEANYNLGVAYWEMNLLDEAIGEFQKVVKGAGVGTRPPNYLQTCTMLATCFMEKGLAGQAVQWYSRALETPDLDEETWLALQYDLGVAYERAGNLPRALERFSEIYSQNNNFRDVAEKIRAFQQKGS
jgi:tetratricopeptide (TPR) repeat protein